ncbi:hypothetical protein PAHAL_4G031000 [Panicum hallii]|uniref:Uncharacterized protein n=1 Tax=Panicum hallii TaxID=206008 RepID=A0A270R6L8_9POAL|nr:hypothetical protein PAHAL_4G031000 [Panicum hallii]
MFASALAMASEHEHHQTGWLAGRPWLTCAHTDTPISCWPLAPARPAGQGNLQAPLRSDLYLLADADQVGLSVESSFRALSLGSSLYLFFFSCLLSSGLQVVAW